MSGWSRDDMKLVKKPDAPQPAGWFDWFLFWKKKAAVESVEPAATE